MPNKILTAKLRHFPVTITGSLNSLQKNAESSMKKVFPSEYAMKYSKYGSARLAERTGDPTKGVVCYMALSAVKSTFPCPLLVSVVGLGLEYENGNWYSVSDKRGSYIVEPEQSGLLPKPIKLIKPDAKHSKKLLYSDPMKYDLQKIQEEFSVIMVNGQESNLMDVPESSHVISVLKRNKKKVYKGEKIGNSLQTVFTDPTTGKRSYHISRGLVNKALKVLKEQDNPQNIQTQDLSKLGLRIYRADAAQFDTPFDVYEGNEEVSAKVLETACQISFTVDIVYRILDVPYADEKPEASSSYGAESSDDRSSGTDSPTESTNSDNSSGDETGKTDESSGSGSESD
jgi:hypothetical protein